MLCEYSGLVLVLVIDFSAFLKWETCQVGRICGPKLEMKWICGPKLDFGESTPK